MFKLDDESIQAKKIENKSHIEIVQNDESISDESAEEKGQETDTTEGGEEFPDVKVKFKSMTKILISFKETV